MNNLFAILVPLAYWFSTRLSKIGKIVQYLVVVLGLQLVAVFMIDSQALVFELFFPLFIAQMCVYEVGYLINDHWSQRREVGVGITTKKTSPTLRPKEIWFIAVVARLLLVTAICMAVFSAYDGAFLFIIFLFILFVEFSLHNILLRRGRLVTFFALYLTRLQFPIILVSIASIDISESAAIAWLLYSLANSLAFTYCYGLKKGYISGAAWLASMGGIELPILATSAIGLLMGTLAALISFIGLQIFGDMAKFLLGLSAYHLLWIMFWSTLRFIALLHQARKRSKYVISHCHTNYSHDGTIRLADYSKWLATNHRRRVFLTDHAEDFDAETYDRLLKETRPMGERFVPGLEYPLAQQHILAHGLSNYLDLTGLPLHEALEKLSTASQRLIWAHPRVALRKLTSPSYWSELLTILQGVDAVEYFNLKNAKTTRYVVMSYLAAWLSCALYGSRPIYLGVDAHDPSDLP